MNLNHLPLSVRVPIERTTPASSAGRRSASGAACARKCAPTKWAYTALITLEQTGGKAVCIYCGQCANVCPVDSITERDECPQVQQGRGRPRQDRGGEHLSLGPCGTGRGLRYGARLLCGRAKWWHCCSALGADFVLDTNFAADLTIVEEASELIRRITQKDRPPLQFTSCCPGWVHFAEIYAPELLPHLSTAKAPSACRAQRLKLILPANGSGPAPRSSTWP